MAGTRKLGMVLLAIAMEKDSFCSYLPRTGSERGMEGYIKGVQGGLRVAKPILLPTV